MIDPHVHLRDWNQSDKETLVHGFSVAMKAGFDRLFDMPNTNPAITSRQMVIKRLDDADNASKIVKGMHYHLYVGLTSDLEQVKDAVDIYNEFFPKVIGLKLFAGHSTGNMGIISEEKQKNIFKTLSSCSYKGVVAIHCEKESLIKNELFENGKWETHSLARPKEAEVESISDMISFALESGFEGTLHVAHISTKESVELVKKNRGKLKITMGATPHHSLCCIEDAREYDRYLKMNPPLRRKEDRDYIFSSLADGTIDWVESDHAPHTLSDKINGASGIPGFQGMLLLADRLRKAGVSEERLSMLFGENALKAFGLEPERINVPDNLKERFCSISEEYPIRPFIWQ